MFEIEHMNEVFDYSLVDGETAEFLKEREYTINGIAEDARIKIGKELKKAKTKLANHHGGVFQKWVQSGGISLDDAYYYINLNELSKNLDNSKKDNFLNAPKSLQKEVMKKSAPDDLKQKVLDGDITTHKEYKQLTKEKAELKQQNAQLQSQVEQAQRSEEIARKKLEDEQNKEPEVIEKYAEPEDYQSIKNMNEHLESEREYYKKLADDFRNEVKGMMEQSNQGMPLKKEDDYEDYTSILLKILEPSEVFIENYKNNLNEQEVINKLEKIIKKLKEQ
ncbi:hypothetical protein JCM2421_05450 [Staphylococcus auricularis]|uniref:DUF3450 domain-containing protein n=1 Tax=Staphylococcus auricularis TaxID=29379 RepID=UPI001BB48754|nr:DUF3450 domain-containing protein [Staphylococcus auricularis]BCU51773.1 hypothetical protein JCM2421_05450 [Staphylococcus auricularis]